MKKLGIFIFIFCVAPWASALSLGGDKQDAGQPGAFLDFAASARSLAMGRAFTGVADDAGATYWNASGLTQLRKSNLVSLFSVLEADSNFGFLSYGHPTADWGVWGVSYVALNSDGVEKRDANDNPLGEAEASNMAFLFSNGYQLNRLVSVGSTVKVVRQSLDTFSDTGYGMDVGLMLHFNDQWQTGLMIKNILAPSLTLISETESYAHDIRLGVKWAPIRKLTVATDINKTEGRGLRFLLGTEYRISPLISFRTGINDTELSAGLGLNLGNWGLDYAFAHANSVANIDSLGNYHRFGLNFTFGKTTKDRRQELVHNKYEKRGYEVLKSLRKKMNLAFIPTPRYMRPLIAEAQRVIKNHGFSNLRDLYEAQGYIHYFERKFPQSVRYIGEALSLSDLVKIDITKNYKKALWQLDQSERKAEVEFLMKQGVDFFDREEWIVAIRTFDKVVLIDPQNEEALNRIEIAKKRMKAPVADIMAQGNKYLEQKRYLDAIQIFVQVKEKNPNYQGVEKALQEAIKALEEAISKDKNGRYVESVDINVVKSRQFYSMGLKKYAAGKVSEAALAWERAVQADPTNRAAMNAYRKANAELEKFKEKNTKTQLFK